MECLPGQGTVLWSDVLPFDIYQLNFVPSYHLIPAYFLNSVIVDGYYSMYLFLVPTGSISLCPCHCICILSCGVLVCLFVVTVADFWYDVMENRLSNSKLHYEFIVPHLAFIFRWGSLNFFSKSFLLQLFCLLVPIRNSFVLVVNVIGFCLSEWYNRLCENWAGVR